MRLIKNILLILIGMVIIIAALSNRQLVLVQFFPLESGIEMPLFLLIFILLLIGVVLGGLASSRYGLRMRRRMRQAEARNKALEDEVDALKLSTQLINS